MVLTCLFLGRLCCFILSALGEAVWVELGGNEAPRGPMYASGPHEDLDERVE